MPTSPMKQPRKKFVACVVPTSMKQQAGKNLLSILILSTLNSKTFVYFLLDLKEIILKLLQH